MSGAPGGETMTGRAFGPLKFVPASADPPPDPE